MGTVLSANDLPNLYQCFQLPAQLCVYEREFERYFLEVIILVRSLTFKNRIYIPTLKE